MTIRIENVEQTVKCNLSNTEPNHFQVTWEMNQFYLLIPFKIELYIRFLRKIVSKSSI